MKVLLLFPMADGQTGSAIYHAFQRLGHQIEYVDAKIEPTLSFIKATKFRPDLVFCSRTRELAKEVVKIKEYLPQATICMWNVDTRGKIDKWKSLFPLIRLCDYHFVVNDYHIDEWNKRFETKTAWLPQGLQEEIYHKPETLSEADTSKYACDVSFAGTCRKTKSYQWRRDIIDAIRDAGFDLKVWGGEGNPRQYNEDHNKMVALSKINLGISRRYENHVRKCTSVRNYKIMGGGGFLLELHRDGLCDVFPRDTLDYYVDPDDAVRKVRYWLDRPKRRRAVAESGHHWAHRCASYKRRMKEALEVMGL